VARTHSTACRDIWDSFADPTAADSADSEQNFSRKGTVDSSILFICLEMIKD